MLFAYQLRLSKNWLLDDEMPGNIHQIWTLQEDIGHEVRQCIFHGGHDPAVLMRIIKQD